MIDLPAIAEKAARKCCTDRFELNRAVILAALEEVVAEVRRSGVWRMIFKQLEIENSQLNEQNVALAERITSVVAELERANRELGEVQGPRPCPLCKQSRNLPDLVSLLKDHKEGGLQAVREAVEDCPSCILSVIVQSRKKGKWSNEDDQWFEFDYKKELKVWEDGKHERFVY